MRRITGSLMSNFSSVAQGRPDIPDSTTPPEITDEIKSLCRRLDPSQTPVYVPVRPRAGSVMDSCFFNLPEKVAADGGSVQHGWTIWERPGLLIEGEFHAVWVSPEGEFVDITPKRDGEKEILFLPDNERVWTGELVDNVRLPLIDNEITRRLIKSSKESFESKKRHYKGGPLIQILAETGPLPEFLAEPFEQFAESYMHSSPVRRKVGRNDPCICGSDKKYKKCCGG
jgi:hypothetical protein